VTTWGAGTPAQGNPKAVNAAVTTGLRRFVKRPSGTRRLGSEPPGARPARVMPTAGPADVYTDPGGRLTLGANDQELGTDAPPEPDRCQLCNIQLDGWHGHLVDTDKRSLACACRACYLLFTHQGAGAGGRYRAVPERICHDPARPLTDAEWSELDIPVAMAFFFFNSALGRVVAGYPSPGGPTECELDLEAWDRLAAGRPLFAAMTPDVEAIFVNRTELGREVFLIPIDMCYSLVGELRMLWQGFDGGAEVHTALATFLTGVRKRARVLTPQVAGQDVEY
jgi:Family of unknown function (DUF5947)